MKTYYGVITEIPGNGSFSVGPLYTMREKKPDNTEHAGREGTVIKEWYGTEGMAKAAIKKRAETMRRLAQDGAI
jgi:hypothetical protein